MSFPRSTPTDATGTPHPRRSHGPLRALGLLGALAVVPVVIGTAGVASAAIAQAITFTSIAPTGAIIGGATYTPTATGGASGNPVTFTISSRSTGICSIAGGVVSFTGPGSCVVIADQAGSGAYAPAPALTQVFPTCQVSALTATCTLSYTGLPDTFTVPDNVSSLDVVAIGGGGGGGDGVQVSPGAPGGDGAQVSVAGLPVIPGDDLPVFIGGRGDGGYAGGGGGSTNVGTIPADPDTIIAGGGGGGGFSGPVAASDGGGGDGGAGGLAAGGAGHQGVDFHAGPGGGGADGQGGAGGTGSGAITGSDGGDGDGGAGAHRQPNDGGGGLSTPGALGFGGAGATQRPCYQCDPDGGSGGGGYGGGGGGATHGGGGGAGGSFGPPVFIASTTYATASNGAPGHGDGLPGSATFTFARQSGMLAFASPAPSAAVIGGTYTPDVTGAAPSGQAVTLSLGSGSAGVCTLSSGVVALVGAGTCTVVADQDGTLSYRPDQATQAFAVGKQSQAITFTSTPPAAAVTGGSAYVPTATGGASGQPVTFAVDGASAGVCTIASGTVSFIGGGTCGIIASQAGNDAFLAAPDAAQSFAVVPAAADAVASEALVSGDVGASHQSSAGLTTVVMVPGPGTVSQSGFTGTPSTSTSSSENAASRVRVCRGSVRASRKGPVRITCALTPAGRQVLRRRSASLRLVTIFTPTGGTSTRAVTTAVMKRMRGSAPRRVPVTG